MNDTANGPEIGYGTDNIFRMLVEESPMPVALYTGSDIVIQMANRAMLRTWGKDESVIGKTLLKGLPELEGQPFYRLLKDVYATGMPYYSLDDQVRLEVGGYLQTFYYNFTYKPLMDDDGKVWGILNTATDVTAQVLAKKAAEESERNFRNMILQSPVAMCILRGPTFIVELANERMFELWGIREHTTINRSIFEALPEIEEEGFQQILTNVYESGVTYRESERAVPLRRDGQITPVYVNFSYQPILDGNAITSILAVAIDVTDQVNARHKVEESEAELRTTQKTLELELEAGRQVQKQKDDFIGIASHELKTPITALNSSLQLLGRLIAKDPASPKVQSLLSLSNVSIRKLLNLLEELLNDTQLNEGKFELHKTHFKVSELVNACCDHVRAAGIHRLIVTGNMDLEIYADHVRVDQVLVNLVNNAVKYAPDSKEIIIHIEAMNKGVRVSVTDNGPGIPADKLNHLFKRYYRIDTTGIQFSGLGLGLFISSEIIKRHGGQIGVESTIGQGSTFWFTLPN